MALTTDQEAARARLASFYNGSGYDPSANPGGLDRDGHRYNFVAALRDLAAVANGVGSIMGDALASANIAISSAATSLLYRDAAKASSDSAAANRATVEGLVGLAGSGPATTLAYPLLNKKIVAATDIKAVCIYAPDAEELAVIRRHERRTSWYNEALNTATRGARREMPARLLVVVRAFVTTLYDLTDLDTGGLPRMWKVIPAAWLAVPGGSSFSCIAVSGARFFLGSDEANGRIFDIDFLSETVTYRRVSYARARGGFDNVTIPLVFSSATGDTLPGNSVSSVAAKVLPCAPLDRYGRRVSTIAVATDAGASVIHPDGRVFDITRSGGYRKVLLTLDGVVAFQYGRADFFRLPYADIDSALSAFRYINIPGVPELYRFRTGGGPVAVTNSAFGLNNGVTLYEPNWVKPENGMTADITRDYTTGWMVGDCKLATLCDGATGPITGGTIPDRSGNANDLTVNGTLQRTALPGSDAVAFSGFSATNYLRSAYKSNFEPGTGDIAVFALVQDTKAVDRCLFEFRDPARAGAGYGIFKSASGAYLVFITDGSSSKSATAPFVTTDSGWHEVGFVRSGSNLHLYIDGVSVASATGAGLNITNGSATFTIGTRADNSLGIDSVSAFKLTKTAPSPDQIAKMYRDESARLAGLGLLGGTSNDVKSLSEDEASGTLAAGTADGVSVFSGLRRVAYHDTASTGTITNDSVVAVAAADGYLAVGTVAEAVVRRDPDNGVDRMLRSARRTSSDVIFRGTTADATPRTLAPRLHVAEGEQVRACVSVVGRRAVDQGERFSVDLILAAYRAVGGNVTLSIAAAGQPIGLSETTASMDAAIIADTVTQTLAVQVTGLAATTMEWSAVVNDLVRTSEISNAA